MRWLITGGCGFIGRGLVASLLADGGHQIRIVDCLERGTRSDLSATCRFREAAAESCGPMTRIDPGHPELVVGDVADRGLAAAVGIGAEVIVHLAATAGATASLEDPLADCRTNVLGTLNYLESAREHGCPRFVYVSSIAPVGEAGPRIGEDTPPRPVSPFGASKLACEGYCSAYHHAFGIDCVALRLGNVYGPGAGEHSGVVARFIHDALRGEPLEIHGNGRQTRDFVFIDDVVRAIRLAATAEGVGGEIFQIAGNAEATVGNMLDKLLALLAIAGVRDTQLRYGPKRAGDLHRMVLDTTKAADRLGWRPEVTLAEGLRRTVDWFLSREGIPTVAA